MELLIAGLVIWVGVHLYPSVFANTRQSMITRVGNAAYQGIFALCIVAGLVLIVLGWRSSVPSHIYTPPAALRHPAMLLVVIGFILFVAANFPATRIKRFLRHPQLTGVLIWAIAHLLMNGDSRSVLLFSVIGAWSLVSMFTINRRDGKWIKPGKPDGWGQDVVLIIVGLAVSALAFYFHEFLTGISLIV